MYIKNFKLLIAALILGLVACNNTHQGRKVKDFFPNGQAKTVVIYNIKGADSTAIEEEHYHSTGELGMRIDSAISYFPNGQVSMRGFYRKGKMVGVWKVYDEKGTLVGQKEYK